MNWLYLNVRRQLAPFRENPMPEIVACSDLAGVPQGLALVIEAVAPEPG